MNRPRLAFVSVVLTAVSASLTALLIGRSTPANALDVKRIESAADSVAQAHIVAGVTPGMTVAVAKNGEIVFARGYGKADVERNVAADTETVYKIGSVTKQFTAAIIMRLVEAGQLSLEDPITKFLPDFPTQGHSVTVRHLLNHTSGIKSFSLGEENGQFFSRDRSYQEMVNRFGRQPFDFKPGEKYQYNNTAYYLLGEIIAKVTGIPYRDYVGRELLQPLGLRHTMHDDHQPIPHLATGYEHKQGKLVNASDVNVRSIGAAGALCSTAGDLVRWTHLLHAGKVVSPTSLQQMTAPTLLSSGERIDYGYGLFLGERYGHRKVYHGGKASGFVALVSHYPDAGLTIVVLMNSGTNTSGQKRNDVEKALARAALAKEVLDLPLAEQDIARYTGTYTVDVRGRAFEIRVFGEGGQLKAQVASESVTRLRYQGAHRFTHGENDDLSLEFAMENGQAQSVTVDMGDEKTHGKRKL